MKNKKGFTLIELLSVLVILGIIAVIIIPIATNNIDKSKKNAAINSAFGLKRALEEYYYTADMSGNSINEYVCSFPDSCSNISYDGQKPSDGRLVLDEDGKVSGYVVFGNYRIIIDDDDIDFSN